MLGDLDRSVLTTVVRDVHCAMQQCYGTCGANRAGFDAATMRDTFLCGQMMRHGVDVRVLVRYADGVDSNELAFRLNILLDLKCMLVCPRTLHLSRACRTNVLVRS